MQLLTRADDAGSSRSANRAILQCATQGIVRNISVMACGLAIEDAAQVLAPLNDVDFGLHVTLNSEWDFPRWGPVSSPENVPDLLESDGCFTHSPMQLYEQGLTDATIEQCTIEIRAQLQRLRDFGFAIRYIDEHMGVGWLPGLRARLQVLADEEKLIYRPDITGLRFSAQQPNSLMESLQNPPTSTCLAVFHPTFDDSETQSITADFIQPNQIARERDADRKLCLDRELMNLCRSQNIQFARYSDTFSSGVL